MAGEILKRLNRIQEVVDPKKLAKEAYDYFKSITPIDTGNARRNTTLQGDEIHANYPYAQSLDNGWSKQAPMGMSQPTEKYIATYIDKELGKL
jgi:hypothetical protein